MVQRLYDAVAPPGSGCGGAFDSWQSYKYLPCIRLSMYWFHEAAPLYYAG